ncbi:hypothetical protein FHR81_000350 [Actinoalloteichus hoggarensis]|uniref:Uncharacterized protein n=1 Tax=Actinoalloteichus hoggarensis TaxID=1470176 RepID=A0A221W2Q0_9PSEU|nr:hypothetical protein [Actinoalloteichus hoggarensis]ASO19969.1 hypothetical protein AHOG_11630 [Actinoalloteichus hoggarensis]MBB5919321.1 hypothetical protein [Actinoalloteichus hoggarensis]
MQVVGTQRAKQLSSTAGSWFRQRLLEAGQGSGLAGLGYFEIPVPMPNGDQQEAHAVLLTPAMLIVVELRSLPWYRGGRLRAETSGSWTVDGMDAGLATEQDVNPGERVTRLVFALREHLRSHGVRDDAVAGLVCVAGPDLKVKQDRASGRLGNYMVCAGDHDSIRRTVIRLDRGGRRWSTSDVRAVLSALHLAYDVPSHEQLAQESFTEHSIPEPRRGREDGSPADPDGAVDASDPPKGRFRARQSFKPETLVIPAFVVPVVLAVVFLVLLLLWLGRGIGDLVSGVGGDAEEDGARPAVDREHRPLSSSDSGPFLASAWQTRIGELPPGASPAVVTWPVIDPVASSAEGSAVGDTVRALAGPAGFGAR